MVVLKQGFVNIFTLIFCSLIAIIVVHGPLPTGWEITVAVAALSLLDDYLVLLTC